jgi:flagellar hook assembly protein FlgD
LPAQCALPTAASTTGGAFPTALRAWPNPSRGRINVLLSLERSHDVELAVYDIAGHRVRLMQSRALATGEHLLHWDGRDDQHSRVASGVYFVRMNTLGSSLTRRVTLLR